jgi:hypothetical protein
MWTSIAALRSGVVLGAMLLLAAACTSASPLSSASPSSSESPNARNFQVTTPDGQVSVSLNGKLPPNWPSDFPVPKGADVAGSGSLGGSDQTAHVAVYSTSQAPNDAYSYYTSNSDLTTNSAHSAGVGSAFVGTMKLTAPYTGSVTVLARNNTTYILIVLHLPGTGTASAARTP